MARTPILTRAPVALLIFNRPELTARVFAAIAAARPPKLLVVADGPRPTRPEDVRLCQEARAVIDGVDWPCEVLTCYSDVNLGCRLRISSGLDWVFEQVDEAIVVEDDCLPHATFFPYCEALLERYRDDAGVHMVSGTTVVPRETAGDDSYYFSRCYHIWGWATWARAWRTYDVDMRSWRELRETDWIERHLGGETEGRIARILLDSRPPRERDGTWDLQWALSGWEHDAVSINPVVNLVSNIGFGEDAAHEDNPDHPLARLPSAPIDLPLRHPPQVRVREDADRAEWRQVYPTFFEPPRPGGRSLARWALRRIRRAAGARRARRRPGGALVLGTAIGYAPGQVAPFLTSLRNTGYDGEIVLFVDRRLRRQLRRRPIVSGVTLRPALPWLPLRYGFVFKVRTMKIAWAPVAQLLWMGIRASHRLPLPKFSRQWVRYALASALHTPMDYRFIRYLRYTRGRPHERILLADVRDVIFQADPLGQPPDDGLAVSLETDAYTLARGSQNTEWVARVYGQPMVDRLGSRSVTNVGVTFGPGAAVTSYLEQMTGELLGLPPRALGIGGADTAVHNMLVWTGRVGTVHEQAPLSSQVATLNGVDPEELRLDDDGRLLNHDGSLPRIVHQYDRQPAVRDRLLTSLASADTKLDARAHIG